MHATSRNAVRIALAALMAGFATPAFAYLDPSTGSMLISAIVGIFASIALAVRTYWYRLKNLFRPRKAESERDEPEA